MAEVCLKGNIVKTKVLSATGIVSTSVLSLLLGAAVHVYAQQDQHGDKQNQQKQEQQQHSQQQEQRRAQEQQPQQQHAQQLQQQEHTQQQQQQHSSQSRTQEQQRVVQSAWQQHSAQNWQSDHRSWQQRGGYSGYRIPDDRYQGYFGSQHGFRIYGLPLLVVGGYPRFQYEGYWISLIDPWPGSWANNWYDTDDVYVSYANNGYYMYNRRYPGIGIAVSISM
jgi:flagellar motor protein MotB